MKHTRQYNYIHNIGQPYGYTMAYRVNEFIKCKIY